jgi:hypothetical protein
LRSGKKPAVYTAFEAAFIFFEAGAGLKELAIQTIN